MSELFDVVEVQLKMPYTVRIIARNKTQRNAEAIASMAVIRRGVGDSFFDVVPAGKFKDGQE